MSGLDKTSICIDYICVEDLNTNFFPTDPKHNSTHGILVAEKAL